MSHIWENCGKQNVHFQRNSSTPNSSTEHGGFKSTWLTTSGCKIPMNPIGLPLVITCAQRPGKKVSPKKEKKREQKKKRKYQLKEPQAWHDK